MNKIEAYTVVIEKRHCEESDGYRSNTNCPLCVAIHEQLPNFKLDSVSGGGLLFDKNFNPFRFDIGYKKQTEWSSISMRYLLEGEIDKIIVTFSREVPDDYQPPTPTPQVAEDKPKVIHVYHAVEIPGTIREEAKVLITTN